MIHLRDLALRLGGRLLFSGVEAVIGPRDRIGLVGPNGAGKTSLVRVLLGEQSPEAGEVDRAGYVSLGYLPQDGVHHRGLTLFSEVEGAFEDVVGLRAKIAAATERLHALDSASADYREALDLIGGWEHRLEELDAHRLPARIEAILAGLGFAPGDRDRDVAEFSGGWQMRIALAKLLLRQPSLLLLDEPTNHLDLPSLRWLESYLDGYEGAILAISHDRSFLDRLCRRIFELRGGTLEVYTGNYSAYLQESVHRREVALNAWKNQQRDLARQQEFIERFRYKATKAAQVQSRIKALDRIERIEIEEEDAGVRFRFPDPPRSGERVLVLEGVGKAYGPLEVLRGFDLELRRGDRLAVVGVNGAGKSTLVRILAGREAHTAGERREGHNTAVAYFAQHQADELPLDRTALEVMQDAAPQENEVRLRTLLGAFLFRGDDVFKPVRVLSGGEKSRLALARMLAQPFNCLILDEPTNHLDLRSISVLQDALSNYSGTLVIVSHDRDFLEPIVTQVLELRRGSHRLFPGRFSEYLDLLDREEAGAAPADNPARTTDTGAGGSGKEARRQRAELRQRLAPLRRKVAALEEEISVLEGRVRDAETAMLDPAFFRRGAETTAAVKAYDEAKVRLEAALQEWAEGTAALEAAGPT